MVLRVEVILDCFNFELMSELRINYANKLSSFLPKGSELLIADLILKYEVQFKISKKRKTKLGDYRFPINGIGHKISVNGDLNEYAFLITTVHEFAHLTAFDKFGRKIKPHGKEWKLEFKLLFEPFLKGNMIPAELLLVLEKYLKNAKASSVADDNLSRTLKKYDSIQNTLVEDLEFGSTFKLNGKEFRKGKKLRKYYLCTSVSNNKQYRVLGIAEIKK